ncbi:unnamed protein product [Effrenium voratum]|nr:unnamed protein product [Effrenium voratum]
MEAVTVRLDALYSRITRLEELELRVASLEHNIGSDDRDGKDANEGIISMDFQAVLTQRAGPEKLEELAESLPTSSRAIQSGGPRSLQLLQQSFWDATVILGLGGLGHATTLLVAIGTLVSIFSQSLFCWIVYAAFLLPDPKYDPAWLADWRLLVGHSINGYDANSDSSLVSRACRGKPFDREWWTHSLLNEIDDYLTPLLSQDMTVGFVLSSMAVAIWLAYIAKELQSVAALTMNLLAIKTGPTLVGDMQRGLEKQGMMHAVSNGSIGHMGNVRFLRSFISISRSRKSVLLLVFGIRAALAALLGFFGALWLCRTRDIANIIQNGVSLVFVLEIDELFFELFAPRHASRFLTSISRLENQSRKPWVYTLTSSLQLLLFWGVVMAFVSLEVVGNTESARDVRNIICNGNQDFIIEDLPLIRMLCPETCRCNTAVAGQFLSNGCRLGCTDEPGFLNSSCQDFSEDDVEKKKSWDYYWAQFYNNNKGIDVDKPLFPQTSPWFNVDLDGGIYLHGQEKEERTAHVRWQQSADALIELQTATITPSEVHDVLEDLQPWLRKAEACTGRCLLPRKNRQEVRFTQYRRLSSWNAPDTVQFTIGLDLSKVFMLLKLSPHYSKGILADVAELCQNRSDAYGSLVALAAVTLEQAKRYKASRGCDHPKAFMQPYLVRSHWGDMVRALSDDERQTFVDDVLAAVSGTVDPEAPLWERRFYDYLKFPETVEMARLVRGRDLAMPEASEDVVQQLPASLTGLKRLAAKVLKHKSSVDAEVSRRRCGLHGPGGGEDFSARQWLQAMLRGVDLMSDHDSPAMQPLLAGSLSGMVWKSMGHWRMENDPQQPNYRFVYLECRGKVHKRPCLDLKGRRWSVPSYMRHVARIAKQFE